MSKEAEEFFHQYKLGDVEPPPRWAMRFADAYAKHYALKMLREDTDKMISKDLKESGMEWVAHSWCLCSQ